MSGAILLGMLGCGRAAERLHVPALARTRGARLTAAFDPRPERRDLIARAAPGCRPFASAEALFEARVVDAVIVASPPESHANLVVLALRAGLPVLVEKPLAASLEEATWIREAERIVRLPVMVGFNRRWWEPVEAVRRALAVYDEPEPTVETTIVSDLVGWGALATPSDPLDDLATHHLDLLRHLLDREIASVSSRRDAAQEIDLQVTFHGGGVARCHIGFGPRSVERIAVAAGPRRYELRVGSDRMWPPDGPARRLLDLGDAVCRRALRRRGSLTRSYECQLRGFVECVRSRAGASPGTTDGVAAMLAVEAARHSLARGGADMLVPPTPTT